jgi:hypothetical protein
MIKNSQEQQTLANPARVSCLSPLVISVLLFYTIVILSVSVVAGFWLYGWARNRIAQTVPVFAHPFQRRHR